jgi:hypothetical protein
MSATSTDPAQATVYHRVEPKICEYCGANFLRDADRKDTYCPQHRHLQPRQQPQQVNALRKELYTELLEVLHRDGFSSARAAELADALTRLDSAFPQPL